MIFIFGWRPPMQYSPECSSRRHFLRESALSAVSLHPCLRESDKEPSDRRLDRGLRHVAVPATQLSRRGCAEHLRNTPTHSR